MYDVHFSALMVGLQADVALLDRFVPTRRRHPRCSSEPGRFRDRRRGRRRAGWRM